MSGIRARGAPPYYNKPALTCICGKPVKNFEAHTRHATDPHHLRLRELHDRKFSELVSDCSFKAWNGAVIQLKQGTGWLF